MKKTVYLAGPCTGLTWKEALAWRDNATLHLYRHGYNTINPLACQKLDNIDLDSVIEYLDIDSDDKDIMETGSAIVTLDEFYVRDSDIVLANFTGAKKQSPGTFWEMGVAWEAKKMIISVLPKDNPNNIPFARRRSHIFVPTLDEAFRILEYLPKSYNGDLWRNL